MNDSLRESLSALMDGEASELELRRILAEKDPSLREQWAAMHRQRESMHDTLSHANIDISQGVMAALDNIEQESAGSWRQALSGLAVAASVAALVVLGGNLSQLGGADSRDAVIADSGRVYPVALGSASGSVPVSAEFTQASPAFPPRQSNITPAPAADAIAAQQARERFEALLRKHTDNAAVNNGQGIISYARVVETE